jgi:hypothetical protein
MHCHQPQGDVDLEDAHPLRPWRGPDMHFSKMELDVFTVSTSMVVGNGESALFLDMWLDKSIKEMAPEVYALVPKRRRKARTVRAALVERTWIPPSALAVRTAVGPAQGHPTIGGPGQASLALDDGWPVFSRVLI